MALLPLNRSIRSFSAVAVAMFAGLVSSPAHAIDLNIDTPERYSAMLDAVRAAEYTRQGYLEGNANPRALAVVAGLWAFAERNPHASAADLALFAQRYDAALATVITGDPLLARPGSVLTGLTAVRLETQASLQGTDTRIGERVIELLGMSIPGLDGFAQSKRRMARFDAASTISIINRREAADALTAALLGVDPQGQTVEGLATATSAYLEGQGYAPMLGAIDPSRAAVNAGLAGLPDYQAFQAIQTTPGAHLAIESAVFAGLDAVQLETQGLLDDIATSTIEPALGINSARLLAAAEDPNDPEHAAAIAEIEARRAAIIASIQQTADERAAVFAQTLILQQSEFPSVVMVADAARSFAGLQLEVNNGYAVAQSGVDFLGGLAIVGAGYASANPWVVAQGLTTAVSSLIGIGEALDDEMTPEQQIYGEIVELRQQVEDLRVEMNERFDIVDMKLDSIFETMIFGFQALGDQIGDLQADVDEIATDIAAVRTTLSRIEAALFGFAQEILLLPLSTQTDLVLEYRADTGADLLYANATPSFVNASAFFYTFATTTARSSAFAGPSGVAITLDNAATILDAAPIARSINDLRTIPQGLETSEGVPVTGFAFPATVAAPSPWSQAASAYAQLARENPWYFAYLLDRQSIERGGETELDEIIADGERITGIAAALRNRNDLFNALLQRLADEILTLDVAVEQAIVANQTANGLIAGATSVDPWRPLDQPAVGLMPVLSTINTVNFAGFGPFGSEDLNYNNQVTMAPLRGYEIAISDNRLGASSTLTRAEIAHRNALTEALENTPGEVRPTLRLPNEQFDGGLLDFSMTIEMESTNYQSIRTIECRIGQSFGGNAVEPLFEPIDGTVRVGRIVEEAWSNGLDGLEYAILDGDLTGQIFEAGTVDVQIGFITIKRPVAIEILSDTSTSTIGGTNWIAHQSTYLRNRFASIREDARADLLADLESPGSIFADSSERIANTYALLDAYLTLGLDDALSQSEILRAALRGGASADGLGARIEDYILVLQRSESQDLGGIGGALATDWAIDLPNLGDHFFQRTTALANEIDAALAMELPSFPYVEYVLADLRSLREHAFDLAIDDTYTATGSLSIDAAVGLIANDITQPGRIDNDELMVDTLFFSSLDHTPPAHGSVFVNPDGAFDYIPDPGFAGEDAFTYRLIARVNDSPSAVGEVNAYSSPTTVVIRVEPAACAGDITGDGAVDLADLNIVLANFGTGPGGDATGDGNTDLADLNLVLANFGAACP